MTSYQRVARLGRMAAMHVIEKAAEENLYAGPDMTDEQWRDKSTAYGKPNSSGFVPDPNNRNRWIPGGGADSVHVLGTTEVNDGVDLNTRDNLLSRTKQHTSTTGFTPYKGGKPMSQENYPHGRTNWSRGLPGSPRKGSVAAPSQNTRANLQYGLYGGKPQSNINQFGATPATPAAAPFNMPQFQ